MDKAELFKNLELSFGRMITPFEIEEVNHWLADGLPVEVINEAVRDMVFENKISFRYLQAILRDYKAKGVDTIEKVELYRRNFQNRLVFKQVKKSVGFDIEGSGY